MFRLPIRIYYEDTDSGGVVYHANHIRFFERSRTEWLRQLGFEQDELLQERRLVFAVHSMEVRYLKPIRFNALVNVTTELLEQRRTSLNLDQRILSEDMETMFCLATVRVVCVDADRFVPTPLPDDLSAEIAHA
ncbi:tol-pal system-associated acyl-CoA thioesterase [Methylonatrum kenyense]|uniref:tol-pal system-associated acyl-CoA thioesterase n=1 Tax=Methylonatrum kenyense TaxID=455253 RepID=UPI0020C149D4|nr:tol-pal system-associated acyl-CoA thioesterase [Methylonatrum kenyense]